MRGSVLIVDDDLDTATLVREGLRKHGFHAQAVTSPAACLDQLRTGAVDVLVTDAIMPGMSGMELCERVARDYPETHTIVITGESRLDIAIASIRAGAYDFITKPVKLDVLAVAISRALDNASLKQELKALRAARNSAPRHGIAGNSPAIRETVDMIERVAGSDATVLITGESGTGKELVARALHDLSDRRDRPFVAINCAAMPAPLLESELFGHVRGAFTDAKQSRAGLFVQAGTGTIFLDEIGEMPMEMQVKLLRVLQERKVRPVGGDEEVAVRARVITATNRELELEVEEKRFREDLYYRINVVPIAVPPLRSRGNDILLLAQHFLKLSATRMQKAVEGISPSAAALLLHYDWPGNVRELENCMERAVALCRLTEITIDDLPPTVADQTSSTMAVTASPLELITIDEMTRRYVRHVIKATDGNKTRAARYLGIDRRSLYRRLEEAKATPESPPAPDDEADSATPPK
jgi:DNA-binding NtrC family response regulator